VFTRGHLKKYNKINVLQISLTRWKYSPLDPEWTSHLVGGVFMVIFVRIRLLARIIIALRLQSPYFKAAHE
jgi:hypothetical protein